MKYVVIDEKGNVLVTEESTEVDKFLKSKEGVFYVISVYSSYISVEKYQTFNNKIYRIDVINV